MFSLLYVSRSLIAPNRLQNEIDSIVRAAILRNDAAEVTGAMLFTGARFAQVLEGPEAAVIEIMGSIERDRRHKTIITLAQGPIARRRFADWSMAYSGSSIFAATTVRRALEDAKLGGPNLIRLLQELARETPPESRMEA